MFCEEVVEWRDDEVVVQKCDSVGRIQAALLVGFRDQGSEFRILGLRFSVLGLKLRIQGLKLRVEG